MKPAQFHFKIEGDIIKIQPIGNGKTLTNDIESVVAKIEQEREIDSDDYFILYLDSTGIWVWVVFSSYGFPHFKDLTSNYEEAKKMLPAKQEK